MPRGEGLRVRLSRVPGETPKGLLSRPLVLPAVLGGFSWTEEAAHSEYDTVRAGQFSQPAMGPASARQLRTVDDIETLTIRWDPPWLIEQGVDPRRLYDELYGILRSRKPVELLASLGGYEWTWALLRANVTIRSISAALREGEPDTRYYTLRIKEWRNAEGRRRGEGRGSKLPTTKRLDANDSLYSLSMHYYHSAAGADAIAKANGIRGWGKKDPLVETKRYRVGSKIKIPKVAIARTPTSFNRGS